MLIPLPKEEDVGSHSGTQSFSQLFRTPKAELYLVRLNTARHKAVRSALSRWSSGTPVSSGSSRMCSLV